MKPANKIVAAALVSAWGLGCFTLNVLHGDTPPLSPMTIRVVEPDQRPLVVEWSNGEPANPTWGEALLDFPAEASSCARTQLLRMNGARISRIEQGQEAELVIVRGDSREKLRRAFEHLWSREDAEANAIRNAIENRCAILFVLIGSPRYDRVVLGAVSWDREAALQITGRKDPARFLLLPMTVAFDAVTLPAQVPMAGFIGLLCVIGGGCDNWR